MGHLPVINLVGVLRGVLVEPLQMLEMFVRMDVVNIADMECFTMVMVLVITGLKQVIMAVEMATIFVGHLEDTDVMLVPTDAPILPVQERA